MIHEKKIGTIPRPIYSCMLSMGNELLVVKLNKDDIKLIKDKIGCKDGSHFIQRWDNRKPR